MSCFWDDPLADWDDISCSWDGLSTVVVDTSTYPCFRPVCDQTPAVSNGTPSTFGCACDWAANRGTVVRFCTAARPDPRTCAGSTLGRSGGGCGVPV